MIITFDTQKSYDDKTTTPYEHELSKDLLMKFQFYREMIEDLEIDEEFTIPYTIKDCMDNLPCKYIFDFIFDICEFVDDKITVDNTLFKNFDTYVKNENNCEELNNLIFKLLDTYENKYGVKKIKLLNDSVICANALCCDNNMVCDKPIINEILCYFYGVNYTKLLSIK